MDSLKSVDVFEALDDQLIDQISKRCSWVKYQQQDMIIDFEDEMGSVYFIVSGRVRVTIRTEGGREIILTEIPAGSSFGELSAIDGETRSACVVALENTQVAAMSISVFEEILVNHPEFARQLMKLLSKRLRAANLKLTEYSFLDAKHRLYNELLRISRPRKGHDGQLIVSPPPIQKELAELIGCRREVISRELSKLKKDEVVDMLRGGLVILRPSVLSDLVAKAWER